MRLFCITLPVENRKRYVSCEQQFAKENVFAVEWIHSLHADVSGLRTIHPYEVDDPGSGFNMGGRPVGIFLGHYIAWNAAKAVGDDISLFAEDDLLLREGWKERMDQAFKDVPEDWDFLFLGSCDTKGHQTTHIKGEVYDVRYPQCLHFYAVRQKALGFMLATQRKVYGPIDCTLIFHTFPHLKVYTVLPRLADQDNTIITP